MDMEKGLHAQNISTTVVTDIDLNGIIPEGGSRIVETGHFLPIDGYRTHMDVASVRLEDGHFAVVLLPPGSPPVLYDSPVEEVQRAIEHSETMPEVRFGRDTKSRRIAVIHGDAEKVLLIHLRDEERVNDFITFQRPR